MVEKANSAIFCFHAFFLEKKLQYKAKRDNYNDIPGKK